MRAQVCDHDPVDHRKDAFTVFFLELACQLAALGKLQGAVEHDEHRSGAADGFKGIDQAVGVALAQQIDETESLILCL